MKLATTAQMSAIDRASQEEYAIPELVLMESAGLGAWRRLCELLPGSPCRIVFVAGAGNNGGDALVMARYCAVERADRGANAGGTSVVLAGGELRGSCAAQYGMVSRLGVESVRWSEDRHRSIDLLQNADWIVDGLTGTGIRGALRSPLDEAAQAINESPGKVVSVDSPSGIGEEFSAGDPAVRADHTFTIGLPKRCLYTPLARPFCGEITVVPLTFPAQLLQDESIRAELLDVTDLPTLVPPIPAAAYKKSRGVVAVYAGSAGLTGAAALCSEAALRSRAGLVTLHVDAGIYGILASKVTSVIVRPLAKGGATGAGEADAVVAGSGWGRAPGRAELLARLIAEAERGVLDADALALLPQAAPSGGPGETWVLTPHPGELAGMNGVSTGEILGDPYGQALAAARRTGSVVVLKAVTTHIVHPDGRLAVVDGMNPALGTAGSGDVLAGMIGGMLPTLGAWDGARAAVLLHSEAGRCLRRERGLFLSEDLLPMVSRLCHRGEA